MVTFLLLCYIEPTEKKTKNNKKKPFVYLLKYFLYNLIWFKFNLFELKYKLSISPALERNVLNIKVKDLDNTDEWQHWTLALSCRDERKEGRMFGVWCQCYFGDNNLKAIRVWTSDHTSLKHNLYNIPVALYYNKAQSTTTSRYMYNLNADFQSFGV